MAQPQRPRLKHHCPTQGGILESCGETRNGLRAEANLEDSPRPLALLLEPDLASEPAEEAPQIEGLPHHHSFLCKSPSTWSSEQWATDPARSIQQFDAQIVGPLNQSQQRSVVVSSETSHQRAPESPAADDSLDTLRRDLAGKPGATRNDPSLDQFVRAQEYRLRDPEAERLRCFEIDY